MYSSAQESLARLCRTIGLFAELSDEEIRCLAERLALRSYPPGYELAGYQEGSTDVHFVLEGELRATVHSLDGKETIFRDFGAGGHVGELAAIDGQPRCASIMTRSHCRIATMRASAFRDLVGSNPAVAAALIQDLSGQVRDLTQRVLQLSIWTVRYRLYAELLKLADYLRAPGPRLVIQNFPTHCEIASRIATHREAVCKELGQLSKDGVVKQRGRTMILLKPEVLAHVLATG